MFIKEKIADRLYSKILGVYPKQKSKYICRLEGKKCVRILLSQHKTKGGRLLSLFCKVKFSRIKK